jgi:hypothetical protein
MAALHVLVKGDVVRREWSSAPQARRHDGPSGVAARRSALLAKTWRGRVHGDCAAAEVICSEMAQPAGSLRQLSSSAPRMVAESLADSPSAGMRLVAFTARSLILAAPDMR